MQDRFKFRVFIPDKKNSKNSLTGMFKVHSLHTGTNKAIITSLYGNCSIKLENNILMQCTGLRDKNGKLIFDGDIIVIPNQYPFYDYKNKEDMKQNLNETQGEIKGESILNYVGIVENIYSSWQYVYHCVNPKKSGISEGINHLLNEVGYEEGVKTDFEVIGNIYENLELLQECG